MELGVHQRLDQPPGCCPASIASWKASINIDAYPELENPRVLHPRQASGLLRFPLRRREKDIVENQPVAGRVLV